MNHRLKRALYQKRRFHHAMCTNGLCWSPITLTATGGHPCHWSGGGSCGLSWRCIYWHCHYLPCFRPPKTNKAPENGWLEDYFPFEMIPFLGDMLVFGVAFFFLKFSAVLIVIETAWNNKTPTPWTIDGWFTYSHHPWKERKNDLNQTCRDSKTTHFFSDICVTP